ncbi:cation:proton antiporter [Bifidobacterium moukalabense]|uniref:cation:proton antiporter n=2 Tax=Bifidobacterium moukalabense TaxID=1333651 RepID=UPI0010F7DBD1|nr:cation:proton antiporter [Bifidobacterium moukalabense]
MATFIISLCAMLALTTCSGLICRKLQLPEVIGQILVGIICGPALLNVLHSSDYISLFSDLGIIILMFLGGVGCDLQLLKKYSKAAIIIACMGVVFPVVVMGGVSLAFGFEPIPAAFIGVVFSATSVSISVAVLKEAGLLDSKEGVSILGAAVADDVIGVILLSVMCTLVNTGSVNVADLGLIIIKQVAFFVGAVVVIVWVAPALMTLAGVLKAPSGIAVMAVIICLAMAWASDLAGLSYAVGAFFAGIAVSNSDYAEETDRYIEPVGDTLFVPVFFVGIGLNTTAVDDSRMIVFIVIMTILGVLTKIVGCGLGGRMAGFGAASTVMIGAGMVPRGEMALITAQIGFNEHVLGNEYYSTIIFIISLVTLVAPLLLKLTIRRVPAKA